MNPLSDFDKFLRELDEPNVVGWKLFSEGHGVKVYRRQKEGSKLYEYKCYAEIPDISPDLFYKVFLDLEYRAVWDKYLKEAYPVRDGVRDGIYWQVVFPLLLDNQNREFTHDDRRIYFIMTHSEPFTTEPPRKKVVRIDVTQSQLLTCSDGGHGLKAFFWYFEDPKGNIPKPFWNWAAKLGIPIYLKTMLKACYSYPEWLKDKKKSFAFADDGEHEASFAVLNNLNDKDDDFEMIDNTQPTAATTTTTTTTTTKKNVREQKVSEKSLDSTTLLDNSKLKTNSDTLVSDNASRM
ncbi:unnamed protein product [Didymodactylos carnosus]|uniref:Phosphatidylcholine transfer protein n=1 Tax=Didymodactylos carnosus TaxID=1234261 RepID=A0A813SEL3_9BILA|nr:unnamed protein product [Didymodactylos carnosus]CAF3579737.1 unnamed protein product [Didymodactylos carnosus]